MLTCVIQPAAVPQVDPTRKQVYLMLCAWRWKSDERCGPTTLASCVHTHTHIDYGQLDLPVPPPSRSNLVSALQTGCLRPHGLSPSSQTLHLATNTHELAWALCFRPFLVLVGGSALELPVVVALCAAPSRQDVGLHGSYSLQS